MNNEEEYFQDPEYYYDEPERYKGPLSGFPAMGFGLPAFFCFLLFIIFSLLYWGSPYPDKLWASGHAVLYKHEYWRLITALFTHANMVHLLSNTPLFLVFGWLLRAYFGLMVFPLSAFLVGILSNLITVIFYNPDIRLIGASGMLYGMVALWLIFYVKYDTDYTVPRRILRAVVFAVLMLFPTTFHPSTSYLAHAAGFGIGLITALLLLPIVRVRDPGKNKSSVGGH